MIIRTSPEEMTPAWEIYRELHLGQGGYAIATSKEVRKGIQQALRRKLGR